MNNNETAIPVVFSVTRARPDGSTEHTGVETIGGFTRLEEVARWLFRDRMADVARGLMSDGLKPPTISEVEAIADDCFDQAEIFLKAAEGWRS